MTNIEKNASFFPEKQPEQQKMQKGSLESFKHLIVVKRLGIV